MQIELSELVELLTKQPSSKSNSVNSPADASLATASAFPSGQHIVVMDRGFVYVGDVSCDDRFVRITGAKNIRSWGTTRGLGELRNGPLESTKLDEVGEVVAPFRAVMHFIPCKGF